MLKNKLFILLVGFYIFWLGVLPLVLTSSVETLCEKFFQKTNYSLDIKEPQVKLSILPILTFKANEIILSSKLNSDKININNLEFKLRILPILSGNFHFNSVAANEITTLLNLNKKLELEKDFFKKIKNTNISFNTIQIKKFETLLFQKDVSMPIKHFGNDLLLERKNRYIKFRMQSNLSVAGKNSNSNWDLYLPKNNDIKKTIFNIQLSNFDISTLKAYLKNYLPTDLKELNGIINIYANKDELITELKNCSAIMNDYTKSIILPDKFIIKSKFNINKNFINFENVEINSPKIHIGMSGRIYNYFGKSMPTVDLNIRLNKSKIEDLVNLLPPFKIEELDAYKLKKHKFYGDIIGNLTIKGRLPEPDIFGDIFANNGILVKPIPNTNQGATVKLRFSGKHAYFDVNVPAGNGEFVEVTGTQEIYNIKFADMTIKSSNNVNLKYAQNVLNPLHEILNFIIGPVPIMDINGYGNISITVKGNRKNPHVWGQMNVFNGTVRFNDLSQLKLENAEAKLNFNDQNVQFNLIKGLVNNKKIDISGSCNLLGKFDFDVKSSSQPSSKLYSALLATDFLPELNNFLPELDYIKGNTDLDLKIYGNVKNIQDLKINENVFAKGKITFLNNKFRIQNVEIDDVNGEVKLDGINSDTDMTASINSLPLNVKSKIKNNFSDIVLNIPKINPNFLLKENLKKQDYLPYISVFAKYKGNIEKIQYNRIFLEAKVLSPIPQSKIKINSGNLTLSNNKINISNLNGYIVDEKNILNSDIKIVDAFTQEPRVNGNIHIATPNLALINEILQSEMLPSSIKKYLNNIEFVEGKADLDLKVINNKLNLFTDLSGIKLKYLPIDLPIEFINGNISIKNNILKLNKINLLADDMPLLLDGEIREIFDRQNFNLYLNSKPKQEFIDKYINKNQIYPIKIKGDIVYWARLKGIIDNYDLKLKIDLNKDSSIYHFGATIGDIENAISAYLDCKVINKNNFKIKEFSYDKKIDSLNGKQTEVNMLKSQGGVKILKDDLSFEDLTIKTSYPTDARIFNIIFRKPNIKQGQFTSDLKFNGNLSNPKILGNFYISETNIPFFDTSIKNIELIFKEKKVNIIAKGDVLGNDVEFSGILKNKLSKPYIVEKGFFYTKNLDLNRIVNKLKISEVDNVSTFESFEDFELASIILNNLRLKADNIELRNIQATNFDALASLSDKRILDVNQFSFNIAQGLLNGKYTYNITNNDMIINLDVNNINANDLTWALFDLKNQIYGDMTGTVNLSCNGTDFQSCMQSLYGETYFNVTNGKMPKLGSLEYLLRAANLVKGGITGISINSIIDIVSPLKTGEFSDIYGSIKIKDGIAHELELTSKGKNLSLFINGTYNFATSIADMQVFGMLSRKLSTMFGPIGNMSLNTLFNVIPGVDLSKDSTILEKINKIPGIELSSKTYRKFIADIYGNINGEDYVTRFQWIN